MECEPALRVAPHEDREDVQLMNNGLRLTRSLCKEYGQSFRQPRSDAAPRPRGAQSTQRRARDEDGGAGDDKPASDGTSDSDSDLSSRDGEDTLGHHAQWTEVQEIMARLNVDERVKLLERLGADLKESSEEAERQVEKLNMMEDASENALQGIQGVRLEEKNDVLDFDITDIPAVHALQRCIASLQPLQKKLQERLEDDRIYEEELEAKAALAASVGSAADASAAAGFGDSELGQDVAKRMQTYGKLGPKSSPYLQAVLEAQKTEIKRSVFAIAEAQKEAQVTRLALDYLDGKVKMETANQDMLAVSMVMAKDMKAKMLAEKRAEALEALKKENEGRELPTEEEMQRRRKEVEDLRQALAVAKERTNSLLATSQVLLVQAGQTSELKSGAEEEEEEGNPEESRRSPRGSKESSPDRHLFDGVKGVMDFPITEAPRIHAELLEAIASLEANVKEEDRKAGNAEVVIRNAEATLKVLEETKTAFLEHMAREKPSIIAEVLGSEVGAFDDSSESSEGEGGVWEEELESADENEMLERLETQERWLRMQLSAFEVKVGEEVADEEDMSESEATEPPDSEEEKDPSGGINKDGALDEGSVAGSLADGVRRLAERIEALAEGEAIGEDEAAAQDISEEEAKAKLRSMPFEELRKLLAVRQQNEKLQKDIEEAQRAFEDRRREMGSPDELLKPDADVGDLDQALVADVRRKCRELDALRRRWWSERQDPSNTARRALAGANLPEGDGTDEPPGAGKATLFGRIIESMTML